MFIKNNINFLMSYQSSQLLEIALYTLVFVLVIAFTIFVIYIFKKIDSEKKQFIKRSEIDSLTNLMTEEKFMIEARKILDKAKPFEYSITKADIDNFKYINNTYGYESGNDCLKNFAKQMKCCYENGILFSRTNADNFVVLHRTNEYMRGCVNKNNLTCLAKDGCPNTCSKSNFSVSHGEYIIEDPCLDLSYMISCAAVAKNQAKNTFGNSFVTFDSDLKNKIDKRNKIIYKMETSLKEHEFKLFFQPKLDLVKNKLVGAEVLTRWYSDDTVIFPDEFIQIFEENGFIVELDKYIFEETCKFLRSNFNNENMPIVSINFSPITILVTRFVEFYTNTVNKYSIPKEKIEIEITESAFVEPFGEIINKVKDLRKLGFKVSLDDFGSMVSSLKRLKDLELDVIKIDRDFVKDVETNQKSYLILKNMIKMIKELKLIVVSEGVETEGQKQILKDLDCDLIQGYLISEALSANDFLTYFSNSVNKGRD